MVALALLCGGCVDSAGGGGSCATECPPCGAGEVCVSYWDSAHPAFSATCLKGCTDGRDCPAGSRCVVVNDARGFPRACVSTSDPPACGPALGTVCSDQVGSSCDGDTLVTNGFGASDNNVCGYERVACANGCVSLLDGGVGPLGSGNAACR